MHNDCGSLIVEYCSLCQNGIYSVEDYQYMECFLFNRNEDYMRISEERLKAGAAKLCEERFSREGRSLSVSPRNHFLHF